MNDRNNECNKLSLTNSMNHQDWKEVVLSKTSKASNTQPHYEVSKEQKIDKETEELSHKKVGGSLGKQIQTARIAKGLKTQKDLANLINVRPDVINMYESGKAIPDNAILQKLRRMLNTQLKA